MNIHCTLPHCYYFYISLLLIFLTCISFRCVSNNDHKLYTSTLYIMHTLSLEAGKNVQAKRSYSMKTTKLAATTQHWQQPFYGLKTDVNDTGNMWYLKLTEDNMLSTSCLDKKNHKCEINMQQNDSVQMLGGQRSEVTEKMTTTLL